MSLPRAFLVAAALATLVACSDDDDAAETGDAPVETTTETTATTVPDDDAEAAAACAEAVREAAPDDALEAFPDNTDVSWTVLDVNEGGLGMQLAEMEPSSDEVGYATFRLVFACGEDGSEPVLLAIYALEGEQYVLLSTTDAAEGGEFAPTMDQ